MFCRDLEEIIQWNEGIKVVLTVAGEKQNNEMIGFLWMLYCDVANTECCTSHRPLSHQVTIEMEIKPNNLDEERQTHTTTDWQKSCKNTFTYTAGNETLWKILSSPQSSSFEQHQPSASKQCARKSQQSDFHNIKYITIWMQSPFYNFYYLSVLVHQIISLYKIAAKRGAKTGSH